MPSSLTVAAARCAPKFLKNWVHHHRLLDRLSRRAFCGALLRLGGDRVTIESGPMQGLALAVSEHVSHAHIRGDYELDTQRAIDRWVSPGFICYDLGASIGYLSLLMARKAKSVYAFEPAPHAAEEIRKHAAANSFHHITVVPAPVSDCPRPVVFSLTDAAYGSRIVESDSPWPTLKLTTITLDDFAAANPLPDFLKIDVEGEEARVLQGARSILRSKKPILCCEHHSEQAARDVEGILTGFGYHITTLNGEPFQARGTIIPVDTQVLALPQ